MSAMRADPAGTKDRKQKCLYFAHRQIGRTPHYLQMSPLQIRAMLPIAGIKFNCSQTQQRWL